MSLALALFAAGQSSAAGVVPLPAEVVPSHGSFHLDAEVPVCGGPAPYFADLLKRSRGLSVHPCAPGDRSIAFRHADGFEAEGYRLEITEQRVSVTATTDAGLFYGAVTLWQLMPAGSGAADLPALVIRDQPVYRWRGLMLDSARHFQSPAFIKSFIDWMALHKLNVLQWHLTDDQGWRLQIRKYPRLTTVGAWRVPAERKPLVYGGFYTQEQVKDIVAFAASRHVQIVPEIELPGHAQAAIAAYPEVGSIDGPPPPVSSKWGIHSYVYSSKPSTLAFLEDVLTEVMELFPSREIHVGGDEAAKAAAYQTDFTQKIGRFLESHGRRLVGWDEILQPGLPKNAIVMSWRGTAGALAAAQAGNDTVLAAWPTLYFDNRQSTLKAEPPGRIKVVSLEDVYRFEPRDPALTLPQQQHILGVQGNVWTEHIRTEERVEWMTFPRAAAVAEVGWTAPERRDWPDFRQRLAPLLVKLQTVGLHAADSEFAKPDPPPSGPRRTSRDLELCSDGVPLLLESGKSIVAIDIMNPCWIERSVDLSQGAQIRASTVALPFNFELGDDVKKIQLGEKSQFEIRIDKCDGPPVATAPLTNLVAHLPAIAGHHDLCMRFARPRLDPMWALDWVEVSPRR